MEFNIAGLGARGYAAELDVSSNGASLPRLPLAPVKEGDGDRLPKKLERNDRTGDCALGEVGLAAAAGTGLAGVAAVVGFGLFAPTSVSRPTTAGCSVSGTLPVDGSFRPEVGAPWEGASLPTRRAGLAAGSLDGEGLAPR